MFTKKDGFCLQHPAHKHHPSHVTFPLHSVKLFRETKNHTNSGHLTEWSMERDWVKSCNEETVSSARSLLCFSHRNFVGILESIQSTNEWVPLKDLVSYISNKSRGLPHAWKKNAFSLLSAAHWVSSIFESTRKWQGCLLHHFRW